MACCALEQAREGLPGFQVRLEASLSVVRGFVLSIRESLLYLTGTEFAHIVLYLFLLSGSFFILACDHGLDFKDMR